MKYFADKSHFNHIMQAGADGFDDEVVKQVLTYLPQAKVALIRMLEAEINSLYPNGYGGTFFSQRYSGYQHASPFGITRRIAQDMYDERVEKKETDEEKEVHELLARAEALLALQYSLPIMGLRPTDQGGFVRMTGEPGAQTSLMSSNEMSAYQNKIYSQAKELVMDVLYRLGHEPRIVYAL